MESTPPLIHMQPFVHIHFLCSTSLSSTAESSVTFTQNRLTNNTYYTLLPLFTHPTCPSFSLALRLRPICSRDDSPFAQTNPWHTFINAVTADISSDKKSHAQRTSLERVYPKMLSPPLRINLNAFHFYLRATVTSLLHLIHHSPLPQHIHVCTYCCLPTH